MPGSKTAPSPTWTGCLTSYGVAVLGIAMFGVLLGLVARWFGGLAVAAVVAMAIAVLVVLARRSAGAEAPTADVPTAPARGFAPPRVSLDDREWAAVERTRADGASLRSGRCPQCGAAKVETTRSGELSTTTIDADGNRSGFIQVQVTFRCDACGWTDIALVRR